MAKFAFIISIIFGAAFCSSANPIEAPIEAPKSDEVGMYGDHFQGDIVLSPEQEKLLNETDSGRNGRTGQINMRYRWPKNSQGIVNVPIAFSSAFSSFLKFDFN